jgi:hypothetical protein
MAKILKNCFSVMMFLIIVSCSLPAIAQLTISGQLRTRTELRDGLGTLILKNNSPSFFTSQRSRLTFNYKTSRVIFQTSLQDVRVWGQDASTISNADGNRLGVHEASAEILFSNKKDTSFKHSPVDYFAVKIGRQELMYDDSRLLGNLDWLQQARRHDAIVLKFLNKGWQADLGAAFNQNTDAFNYNGTYYTPANVLPYVKDSKGNLAITPANFIPFNNSAGISSKTGAPSLQTMPSTNGLYQDYKALQYLYVSKTFGRTKVSGLILSDQFGKYINDSVKNIADADTGYIYGKRFNQKGVNTRITAGVLLNSFLDKKKTFALTAGYYYQAGKDRDDIKLNAFTSTLALAYTKNKFTYTAGWDYVSGNNSFSTSTVNHRFDPLYGTPHKFWGFMDYFYVGTGAPTGGLSDAYAKIKYTSFNKRFVTGLDYHHFSLANNQKDVNGNAINKYLGSEFDLVTDYSINKMTTLEYGFSLMAATKSMEYAKNISPDAAKLTGIWSFLMIIIKPEFLFK